MYRSRIKKTQAAIIMSLATLLASLSLLMTPLTASAANISIGGPSDCTGFSGDNAIMRCGAHSVRELVNKYNNSAYIRAVYSDFGISRADIDHLSDTAVAGRVTKSGDVFVGDRLVARNAVTGGRKDIEPGSTRKDVNGAVYFRRHPSVSFASDSLPAFVSMKNGQFQFAVIAACGNATSAAAVAPPRTAVAPARPVTKPPKRTAPAPTQTQTQTQSQSQQVVQNQTIENTSTTVTPVPTPTPAQTPTQTAPAAATLPNTGPGEVAGLFAISSIVGYFGYRRFLVHKFGR